MKLQSESHTVSTIGVIYLFAISILSKKYVHSKGRLLSLGLDVADKLDIFIATVVVLEQTAKWQSVEQSVEPVVCLLVDVRVLTQELTQCRRVGGVVVVEVGRSVQHHQHDQTLLAFYRHVVVVSHVELSHTEIAATQRTDSSH